MAEFKDILQNIMDERGLNQSDVARLVWGKIDETRKGQETVYSPSRNRSQISRYVDGKVVPRRHTRKLLAQALNVPLARLMPEDDPTKRAGSGVSLNEMRGNRTHLTMDLVLPNDVAQQVVKLVWSHTQ